MFTSRLLLTSALLTLVLAALAPSAFAKTSPLAGCKLPTLDSSTATSQQVGFPRNGVEHEDTWEPRVVCKSGSKTVRLTSKINLHATNGSTAKSGKLTGPFVLMYEGPTFAGNFSFVIQSSYTCTGGTCESEGIITRRGKRAGTITMTFNRTARTLSYVIIFEDILVSS